MAPMAPLIVPIPPNANAAIGVPDEVFDEIPEAVPNLHLPDLEDPMAPIPPPVMDMEEEDVVATDDEFVYDDDVGPQVDHEPIFSDDEQVSGDRVSSQDPSSGSDPESFLHDDTQLGQHIGEGIQITDLTNERDLPESFNVNKFSGFVEFAQGLNAIVVQQMGTNYFLAEPTILLPLANCRTKYYDSIDEEILPDINDIASSSIDMDLEVTDILEGSDVELEIMEELERSSRVADWVEFCSRLSNVRFEMIHSDSDSVSLSSDST